MASSSAVLRPFTDAHRIQVQRLYRKALKQSLDWVVFRDIWRQKAIEIRVKFERNRDVRDPRSVARLLEEGHRMLAKNEHPDPYRPPDVFRGGSTESEGELLGAQGIAGLAQPIQQLQLVSQRRKIHNSKKRASSRPYKICTHRTEYHHF